MQDNADNSADRTGAARIMIMDNHEISRAACRALLHAEGLDIAADAPANQNALAAARTLRPDVVIIDVAPTADDGLDIARRLRALPDPPSVILISSADRSHFGSQLEGYQFLPKADLCATAIAGLSQHRERA
jgi:DNA-binding NarL/FixJ family response regulator